MGAEDEQVSSRLTGPALAKPQQPQFASRTAQRASETKRTHRTWIDSADVEQAYSAHPYAEALRSLLRNTPEAFCDDWLQNDRCPVQPLLSRGVSGCWCVVLGDVLAEVGHQPDKYYRLETLEHGLADGRSMLYAPDTVLWWPRPWASNAKARAQRAYREMVARGEVRAVLERERLRALAAMSPRELRQLRYDEAARQRHGRCECLRTGYVCPGHDQARPAAERLGDFRVFSRLPNERPLPDDGELRDLGELIGLDVSTKSSWAGYVQGEAAGLQRGVT
jgi:hypothetical protein